MANAPLTLVTGSMKGSRNLIDLSRRKWTKPVRPQIRTHPSRSNAVPTPNSLEFERTQDQPEFERTRPRRTRTNQAGRKLPKLRPRSRTNPSQTRIRTNPAASDPNEPKPSKVAQAPIARRSNEPCLAELWHGGGRPPRARGGRARSESQKRTRDLSPLLSVIPPRGSSARTVGRRKPQQGGDRGWIA